MKKLLEILGSISLIATSGIAVVACTGDEVIDDSTNTNEVQKLISEFKQEVAYKYQLHVHSKMVKKANLINSEATDDLSFFEKENLKNIYEDNASNLSSFDNMDEKNSVPPVNFYDNLSGQQEVDLKKGMNGLLTPYNFTVDFKNDINTVLYSILISEIGRDWIGEPVFDYPNAELQYTESEEFDDKFIANINIDYATKYQYLDATSTITTETITGSIVITISDDEILINTIDYITNELPTKLLAEGNDLVWMDYNKLVQNSPSLKKADLLTATTNEYEDAIYNYMVNEFVPGISDVVKEEFENSTSVILNNVDINLDNDIQSNNYQKVNSMGQLAYRPEDNLTKDFVNQEWYHLYFGEVKDDEQIALDGSTTNVKGDKNLYNNLSEVFVETAKNYSDKFLDDFNNLISETDFEVSNNAENRAKMSVAHELMMIKNMTFESMNGYKQSLNDITFHSSIAINNNNSWENEMNFASHSEIFSSYYFGIEELLNTFHDFYGLSPIYHDGNATRDERKTKAKMTGETGVNGLNIWDDIYDSDDLLLVNHQDSNGVPYTYSYSGENVTTLQTREARFLSLDHSAAGRRAKAEGLISPVGGISSFTLSRFSRIEKFSTTVLGFSKHDLYDDNSSSRLGNVKAGYFIRNIGTKISSRPGFYDSTMGYYINTELFYTGFIDRSFNMVSFTDEAKGITVFAYDE